MAFKVHAVGRLGADPELKYTNAGTAVCNFTMASGKKYKTKEGEKKESTEWMKVTAWGKLGEICGEYLKKGKQISIEGEIQTRKWEGKDGNTRYTTEIVLREMEMLGGGDKPREETADVPSEDSDIPF